MTRISLVSPSVSSPRFPSCILNVISSSRLKLLSWFSWTFPVFFKLWSFCFVPWSLLLSDLPLDPFWSSSLPQCRQCHDQICPKLYPFFFSWSGRVVNINQVCFSRGLVFAGLVSAYCCFLCQWGAGWVSCCTEVYSSPWWLSWYSGSREVGWSHLQVLYLVICFW